MRVTSAVGIEACAYTDCFQGRTTGTEEVVARKTIPSSVGDLDPLEITTIVNTVTPVLGEDRKPTGETTRPRSRSV